MKNSSIMLLVRMLPRHIATFLRLNCTRPLQLKNAIDPYRMANFQRFWCDNHRPGNHLYEYYINFVHLAHKMYEFYWAALGRRRIGPLLARLQALQSFNWKHVSRVHPRPPPIVQSHQTPSSTSAGRSPSAIHQLATIDYSVIESIEKHKLA